ncbi:hypothetical protein AMS68_004910 [Peltaster fructicola]|uniref:Uncharacterized protein n=1 Tax=Peltaster fructicola TaxID=286661 RepID=A0A6H0XXB2_9PEZI|nr:hypothetical protein AMS68_004910 [Peltaster fructicola]
MELIMDPSIPSALPKQPASNGSWAPLYMESVAERMKRRRKPTESVLYEAATPASKRPKVEQISNTKTIQPTQVSTVTATQIDHAATLLTPPSSDNGVASTEDLYIDDTGSDINFTNGTLRALQRRLATYCQCVGRRQAERIVQLLQIATPATQEEGPFLDEEGVKPCLAAGQYHDGPIFVRDQQPMPTVSVSQLCSEFYDDTAKVWIQDPAVSEAKIATREVEIGEVKARLQSGLNDSPWNCLEMASPYEDGLRPKFLNTEECRLLTKIKIPDPEPGFKGAKVGRRFLRHGYKEAEKWVLLAQSGALTETAMGIAPI